MKTIIIIDLIITIIILLGIIFTITLLKPKAPIAKGKQGIDKKKALNLMVVTLAHHFEMDNLKQGNTLDTYNKQYQRIIQINTYEELEVYLESKLTTLKELTYYRITLKDLYSKL